MLSIVNERLNVWLDIEQGYVQDTCNSIDKPNKFYYLIPHKTLELKNDKYLGEEQVKLGFTPVTFRSGIKNRKYLWREFD